MKYLRFNEEKKKILKSLDDKNNSIEGSKNADSDSKIGRIEDLEKIEEEKEEEASGEIYDINNHSDSQEGHKESSESEGHKNNKKDFFASEKDDDDKKSLSDSEKNEKENLNLNNKTRKGFNSLNTKKKNNNSNNNLYRNNAADNSDNSESEIKSNESGADADEPKKGVIFRSLMKNNKSGENLGGKANNNNSSKESKIRILLQFFIYFYLY